MAHHHCAIHAQNGTASINFIVEAMEKRIEKMPVAHDLKKRFCLLNDHVTHKSFAHHHIGFRIEQIVSFHVADEMELLSGFHNIESCLRNQIPFSCLFSQMHQANFRVFDPVDMLCIQ